MFSGADQARPQNGHIRRISACRIELPILSLVDIDWSTVAPLLLGAGTAVGVILKAGVDFLTERTRNTRQDRVWRREKLISAAADFLSIVSDLSKASYSVGRAAMEVVAERQAKTVYFGTGEGGVSRGARPSASTALEADRSMDVLRLFAPADVVTGGETLLELARTAPRDETYDSLNGDVVKAREEFVRQVQRATGSVLPR